MSYELIVGRKTPGDLLNLTNSVTTASWITQRTRESRQATFTYLRTPQSKIEEGDVCTVFRRWRTAVLWMGIQPRAGPLGACGCGLL